jgi:uncharacterized protein YaaN involved in tellurite resistance
MSEFNNRINTQRKTLRLINGSNSYGEALLSLSGKAINRWVIDNHLDADDNVVVLVKEISEKLFFLANKSQEQVTEEYGKISTHVDKLMAKLSKELSFSH